MDEKHIKYYSHHLDRDVDMLVFGNWGYPVLVFPTTLGRYYQAKDMGLIESVRGLVESGRFKIYCVDSIDADSWYARHLNPEYRVLNHMQYDKFLHNELVPYIQQECHVDKIAVAGCSFGGFHAANYAFKHPDRAAYLISMSAVSSSGQIENRSFGSAALGREVMLSVVLPVDYQSDKTWSLLLVNDGQDFEAVQIGQICNHLAEAGKINPPIIVGIHANQDRLQEYGTAIRQDYAGRGSRAGQTTSFVLNELIPYLGRTFRLRTQGHAFAGFSLGGLMALDIVWNHPHCFAQAAVFSGSLWWRSRALDAGYEEADRIMHAQIREAAYKPGLRFWFQSGTQDETDDRDGDGVIDSIQDTLECVAELERKGYRWGKDIRYLEIPGGEHNPNTWAQAMPDFLIWAFGK